MILHRAFLASLAVCALVAPAHAQNRILGGGFLEMVATFRDPTPRIYVERPRPQSAAPQAAPVPPLPVPVPAAPIAAPAPKPLPAPVAITPPVQETPAVQQAALTQDYKTAAIPEEFHRRRVAYDGHHKPGTIIVDTPRRFLFLVQENGKAIRYGIGVGRPGFEWAGLKVVTRKAEWPGWTPPPDMRKRLPDLPVFMRGGPGNPLGARALYLGSSLYRIHGTNEPWTIGRNVSSGCIRMMDEDVIDLYNRTKVGTHVIVI
jgi:lipoprotein-anchoring transpeptidase ErfK/SrfK